jgi:NAD(P)-dependent dehydrogenase (short-subunit alcohol dehydrogenase family)
LAHLGKGGRIISIGSYFADRVPAPVLGVYAASKSALAAFTKGLARELGPKEITVNLVQPGSINTDMNPDKSPYADTLRQFMALGQFGKVDDIASVEWSLRAKRSNPWRRVGRLNCLRSDFQ